MVRLEDQRPHPRRAPHVTSFNTLVTLVLLYGVEVWGGSIPKSTWKEFENVQKHFLTKFLQVKKQTPYTLLLKTGSHLIEIMAMERVVEYMLVENQAQHRATCEHTF